MLQLSMKKSNSKQLLLIFINLLIFKQGFSQLNINLINQENFKADSITEPSFTAGLNDVWGYESNAREYAIFGSQLGVEIFDITNANDTLEKCFSFLFSASQWKDVKTWSHYAYVTSESAPGLLIIDLQNLPDSNLNYKFYSGNQYNIQTAHNIYIDEKGYAYLFGSNALPEKNGFLVLDLSDPWNPSEVGVFNEPYYFHDGMVRDDTLWGSAMRNGALICIDVSDKQNMNTLGLINTPSNGTHHNWISDDDKYVFTADEVSGAFITSYNVEDPENMFEVDRYRIFPDSMITPHNLFVKDDYIFTSYYEAGVVIIDAKNPHNLIKVGHYDTYPDADGMFFNGCWGVYPYLGSENIIATDRKHGLFILEAELKRGAYLQGVVSDNICGTSINQAKIEILNTNQIELSSDNGRYATGFHQAGFHTVQVSKFGYQSITLDSIYIQNDSTTILDIALTPVNDIINLQGLIRSTDLTPISDAQISIFNDSVSYNFTSLADGSFDKCNIISGSYNIHISKWGWTSHCIENYTFNAPNDTLDVLLSAEYYDNFNHDLGWEVLPFNTFGGWQRGATMEIYDSTQTTLLQPNFDSDDCGQSCYFTGIDDFFLDHLINDTISLTSPEINFSIFTDSSIYLQFDVWFKPFSYTNLQANDNYLEVILNNENSSNTTLILLNNSDGLSEWKRHTINLSNYLYNFNDNYKIIFKAYNHQASFSGSSSFAEIGIDNFRISNDNFPVSSDLISERGIVIYPNPAQNELFIHCKNINSKLPLKYEIYSLEGKLLKSDLTYSVNRISLEDLSAGIYFLKIYSNDQEYIEKFSVLK